MPEQSIYPEVEITLNRDNFDAVNEGVSAAYGVDLKDLADQDPMEAFCVVQSVFEQLEGELLEEVLPADVAVWVWASVCTRKGLDYGKQRRFKAIEFHVDAPEQV